MREHWRAGGLAGRGYEYYESTEIINILVQSEETVAFVPAAGEAACPPEFHAVAYNAQHYSETTASVSS